METARDWDADVIVVGSGFGGAVAALRLAEQGRDVLVLERGRRHTAADLRAARRVRAATCGPRRWACAASSPSPSCGTSG